MILKFFKKANKEVEFGTLATRVLKGLGGQKIAGKNNQQRSLLSPVVVK